MNSFLKKILYFFAVLSFFSIIPNVIINYIIDPYGLIGEISNDYNTEPNLRSLKNWVVSEKENNHQNLFFSNSTIEFHGMFLSKKKGLYELYLDNLSFNN